MPSPFIYAAVTVGLVFLLVLAEARDWHAGKWVFKPLASLGFIATALSNGATTTDYGTMVVAALVLSMAGDVFLLGKGKVPFLAGLGAFLLGHVAFAVAFVVRGASGSWTALGALLAGAIALVVGRWLLPHVEAGMKVPVLAYITVITCMVALSLGTAAHLGGWIIPVAAVCFFVSDLSVARDRFVAPGFFNRAWGLPLYYGAQLLFGLGVNA